MAIFRGCRPVLLLLLMALSVQPAGAVSPAEDDSFNLHRTLKRMMYGFVTLQSAIKIFMGDEQPLLPFRVLEDPPSIFINFQIPGERVDALTEYLALPEGFELTPVAIAEGEPARYYLSLNIYAVSGLGGALTGQRAEWSVYVSNNQGPPRYMVVEAHSSALSLDSVNWFTQAVPLTHELTAAGIQSDVQINNQQHFTSTISQTGINSAKEVMANNRWSAANDLIYWRDGVADRTFYNGQLIDTPMLSIDPAQVQVSDTTQWQPFIEPEPVSAFVFQTGLEFAISPWYNIQ